MLKAIQDLKASGDFTAINRLIPYAGAIGLHTLAEGDVIVTVLRRRQSNIGNYFTGAMHGGVIAALMEHAAVIQLLYELERDHLPKIINISVDYLRPSLDADTRARAVVIKQGQRIANVRVEAWQHDPAKPVAAAHAHFLLT